MADQPAQSQHNQQGSPNPNNMDPQILAYIAGLVFMKRGNKSDLKDADKEVYSLYNKFQEDVFNLAYRQLSPEKQQELNQVVTRGANQTQIQEFVLKEIPNFQKQLEAYIEKFQEEYLGELAKELENIAEKAKDEKKEDNDSDKMVP